MLTHSITPCTSGRTPTLRNVSLVSEAPIKKSERVIRCFANLFTAPLKSLPIVAAVSPMSEALLNIYVLKRMATTNHTINLGTHSYHGFALVQ